MSDQRRVSECSSAELLEAGLRAAGLGWESGRVRLDLFVEEGVIRRAVQSVWESPPLRASVGRRELDRKAAA